MTESGTMQARYAIDGTSPTSFIVLLSTVAIFLIIIHNALVCTRLPTKVGIAKTYAELFDEGNFYYNRGEVTGLLFFWSSNSRQCYTLAMESYSQAINLEPHHTDALANRAASYINLEQYHRAIVDYLRILELNPQDQHARLGIALAYEESGQLEMAASKYEEAVQFMENSEYWRQLYPDDIVKYRHKAERLRSRLQ